MVNDKKKSIRFVVLLGVVSLFADITYEGARSINGPFLDKLSASGSVVGWIAGLGELFGYSLRILSGYLSDKTKKYWVITIVGYSLNLISVPLLAFVGLWQIAMILMILERVGKAIRTPARDAMLSYGAHKMGRGWGFGLHNALDQTGATLGPLLMAAVLFYKHQNYKDAYLLLFIPACIALTLLLSARSIYPDPESLEIKNKEIDVVGYSRKYWYYLIGAAFIAAGYADFPLIAFHFKKVGGISEDVIPIMYSVAMVTEGIASLILGKLLDRSGMIILIASAFVSLFFAPLVFLGNTGEAWTGMVLWGIGMGAQGSVLKAVVADLIPQHKRGTAYGLFDTGFGIAWFLGSVIMGYLYDFSIPGLVAFSVITQLIAVIWFLFMFKNDRPKLIEQ